mmetsp:Transcript_11538/g.29218  ORF Transcript_11538/g.29218 Transcript_11538/m.29218 type:complete len:216 (-) Transcript_11538:299-946(-)
MAANVLPGAEGQALGVDLHLEFRRVVKLARLPVAAETRLLKVRADWGARSLRQVEGEVVARGLGRSVAADEDAAQQQRLARGKHEGIHVRQGEAFREISLQQWIFPQVPPRKAEEREEELGENRREIRVDAVRDGPKQRQNLLAVVPVVVDLVANQPGEVPERVRAIVAVPLALVPQHSVNLLVPGAAVEGHLAVALEEVEQGGVRDLVLVLHAV